LGQVAGSRRSGREYSRTPQYEPTSVYCHYSCPEQVFELDFRAASQSIYWRMWRMEGGSTGSPRRDVPVQADGRAGWRLFHIVTSETPLQDDFRSMLGKGRIPRPQRDGQYDAEVLRRAAGVSCYETREQARDAAIRYWLGTFIAELFIPDDGCAIEITRTGSQAGHHTVWASMAYFASRTISITPL
jgi:hypothetical protein